MTGTTTSYETPLEDAAVEHGWIHETTWGDMVERHALHVFERGEGNYLYDIHGRRLVDAVAGLMRGSIGHGGDEGADGGGAGVRERSASGRD